MGPEPPVLPRASPNLTELHLPSSVGRRSVHQALTTAFPKLVSLTVPMFRFQHEEDKVAGGVDAAAVAEAWPAFPELRHLAISAYGLNTRVETPQNAYLPSPEEPGVDLGRVMPSLQFLELRSGIAKGMSLEHPTLEALFLGVYPHRNDSKAPPSRLPRLHTLILQPSDWTYNGASPEKVAAGYATEFADPAVVPALRNVFLYWTGTTPPRPETKRGVEDIWRRRMPAVRVHSVWGESLGVRLSMLQGGALLSGPRPQPQPQSPDTLAAAAAVVPMSDDDGLTGNAMMDVKERTAHLKSARKAYTHSRATVQRASTLLSTAYSGEGSSRDLELVFAEEIPDAVVAAFSVYLRLLEMGTRERDAAKAALQALSDSWAAAAVDDGPPSSRTRRQHSLGQTTAPSLLVCHLLLLWVTLYLDVRPLLKLALPAAARLLSQDCGRLEALLAVPISRCSTSSHGRR